MATENIAHRATEVVRKIVHIAGSSATTTAWVAQQDPSLLVDVGDRIGRSIKQPSAGVTLPPSGATIRPLRQDRLRGLIHECVQVARRDRVVGTHKLDDIGLLPVSPDATERF